MERDEENDLGWSKTFVNSSIMADFHVAAPNAFGALRHLGNTPLRGAHREWVPGMLLAKLLMDNDVTV
jgi:hypothetical protein